MDYIYFFLINAFAGLFQGIIGFGQGLIAVPLSLLITDKSTVLTAMMIMGAFLNILLVTKIKHPLDKNNFWPLVISGFVGMPIGLYFLNIMSSGVMKIIVGLLSIFFTILMLLMKIRLNTAKRSVFIAGFLSGILQTSIGMPGPPVVILFTGSNLKKNNLRKILASYFFILSIVTIPLFMVSGVFKLQGVYYGIGALPFIYLGGHFGNKFAHLIPQKSYKLIALVTVLTTGLVAVNSGLKEIF